MKAIAKSVCIILVAIGAGAISTFAQADSTTNKPAAAVRGSLTKRYSGKIASVDAQGMTITVLQGAVKDQLLITSQTKIFKVKNAATIQDLAAGQTVTGDKRQDANGKWTALTVRAGDPRQLQPEPASK